MLAVTKTWSKRVFWPLLPVAALAARETFAQPLERPADTPEHRFATAGADTSESAADPDGSGWLELKIEFDDSVANEHWAAAAGVAQKFLNLTASEFGPDSNELAVLRVEVAAVQSRNGDFAMAEVNIQEAMEHFVEFDGRYSESMIEPYLVLGDNYRWSGDFIRAMSAYDEARTTSRRVKGPLNLGQIEIFHRMSDTAAAFRQLELARQFQAEALALVERSYEPHAPETLKAIYGYAYWLRKNDLFTVEREQYERAARIIRKHYGDESPLLVRPLRERANSYRMQGAERVLGILGLRDALEILEANPDPFLSAEVLRDLGDWEVAFSKVGTDGSEYQAAWNLLARHDDAAKLREEWFGANVMVLSGPLDRSELSTAPDAPSGNVLLRFTVDPNGLTRDVEVVESHPAGLKDEAFADQLRRSRFRPMMRDGELISTRRAYDIRFQYSVTRD